MRTVYRYCSKCNEGTKMPADKCSGCGEPYSDSKENAPDYYVQAFRSGYYEHIALDPIYIKNRKQLRQETEARGLTSHYIH